MSKPQRKPILNASLPAQFRQIRIVLAREPGHPQGDDEVAYIFVAPIDAEGRIDQKLWRAHSEACRVARQRPNEDDQLGHLVYHAAACYNAGDDCITPVSMAKLFATEVANRVAYQAVQMHGGYGYMREFPVERFFRDVRLWTIASGTSEIMKEIIARRLL